MTSEVVSNIILEGVELVKTGRQKLQNININKNNNNWPLVIIAHVIKCLCKS